MKCLRPYLTTVLLSILLLNCNRLTNKTPSIHWIHSIDSALVIAKQTRKPIMVDFMAEWCPPCQAMEDSTFNQPNVIVKSEKFVTVRIDVDKQPDVAVAYNGNARKYGGVGIPNMLFLSPDNRVIKHIIGYHNADKLIAVMDSAMTIFSDMGS